MRSLALPDGELSVFLRRRRRRLVVEAPPLAAFLAETLDLTSRLVPAEAGSLLLDDPTSTRRRSPLTFVAAFGVVAPKLVGVRMPSGKGVAGLVYRNGETHVAERGDPHLLASIDDAAGFRTRSLIAAPVYLERTVCGVFELVNRKGRASFDARDVEVVELLAHYVSRAILNAVDIVKQNELALRDELTGLGNLRALDPMLEDEVRRAERRGDDVAVLFLDVDRLKALNDRIGHRAGSEALRRLGETLTRKLGPRGRAFRFGGDELVVVCPGHDMASAGALAEELRRAIAKGTKGPMPMGGRLPALTVSVGVATLGASIATRGPRDAASLAARLIAAADHALYRAKRAGRDRVVRANRRDDRLGNAR